MSDQLPVTSYQKESVKKYLEDLAAKLPAPGGGSAAALTGALGAALLSMVSNFTIGKDRYKDVEQEIKETLKETERIRKKFLSLLDLDVRAYYKVFKSRKSAQHVYQKNLIIVTKVPLEMCKLAISAYKFCPFLLKRSNKYLISDVYVAKELLKSCFKSAELNVKINLPLIKDKKFASQTKKIIESLRRMI